MYVWLFFDFSYYKRFIHTPVFINIFLSSSWGADQFLEERLRLLSLSVLFSFHPGGLIIFWRNGRGYYLLSIFFFLHLGGLISFWRNETTLCINIFFFSSWGCKLFWKKRLRLLSLSVLFYLHLGGWSFFEGTRLLSLSIFFSLHLGGWSFFEGTRLLSLSIFFSLHLGGSNFLKKRLRLLTLSVLFYLHLGGWSFFEGTIKAALFIRIFFSSSWGLINFWRNETLILISLIKIKKKNSPLLRKENKSLL